MSATFILCQSPSKEEAQLDGFSLDLTKDTNMQSLSLPCIDKTCSKQIFNQKEKEGTTESKMVSSVGLMIYENQSC